MLNLSSLPPLPNLDWQNKDVSAFAEYLDYYGIHFSKIMADKKVSHIFGSKNLGGFTIAVHYFSQPKAKACVMLNHGYMDHVGLYTHLIKRLLDEGFNVLAYDLPGHGLSSGEQAGIANFYCYQKVFVALLSEASKQGIKPKYLIGQSTGGSISMDYLLHHPQHSFKKLILLAPLVKPKGWLGIQALLFAGRFVLNQVKRDFVENSADKQFLDFIKNAEPLQTRFVKASWVNALDKWQAHFNAAPQSDVPTLIIQGDKDVTVEWEYNVPAIKQHFTQVTEVIVKGGNHHLVNESEPLREKVFDALFDFLK